MDTTDTPAYTDGSLTAARGWFREQDLSRTQRSEGRWLSGVSGGLARRFKVNVLVVRVAWVLSLAVAPLFLAYLALWILMPIDPAPAAETAGTSENAQEGAPTPAPEATQVVSAA